jgi:hypothetical protein
MSASSRDAADFVQLAREFVAAHAELSALFATHAPDEIPFMELRALVGDDDGSVLYRLKERSHALFRTEGPIENEGMRRELVFDLAVGSLFHEAMKLRESLYQCEVYGPRIAELRSSSLDDEAEDLLAEFEKILAKSMSRVHEVAAEVRILLAQSRDQLRRLLVERADQRIVTRFLLGRRPQVDAAFPEGFAGLMEAMHGRFVDGLVEAVRSLLESAYFVEAMRTLREAAGQPEAPLGEIDQLMRYAEGMQAFLDGDYRTSLSALEAWADLAGHEAQPDFARLASSALSRLERLVEEDDERESVARAAKELQLRLDAAST